MEDFNFLFHFILFHFIRTKVLVRLYFIILYLTMMEAGYPLTSNGTH
jgi:hypothetical protein